MKPLPPDPRAETIFQRDIMVIIRRTDRMFFKLLLGQWAAAVVIALAWSPRTWIGQYWTVHQHVLAAALLGGLFAAYPLYLIRRRPGASHTRHMIAVGQMLQSALLVHVTGGRIETHFHVFGSLALLAFYRDWRVLITASAVVYIDHVALGIWFPLSVYGIDAASIWRSVEHAFWVVFEVIFLAMSCRKGIEELSLIAERQVKLEDAARQLETSNAELREISAAVQVANRQLTASRDSLEAAVANRTQELEQARRTLEQHVRELETLNRIMMGREERILELKERLKTLQGGAAEA